MCLLRGVNNWLLLEKSSQNYLNYLNSVTFYTIIFIVKLYTSDNHFVIISRV